MATSSLSSSSVNWMTRFQIKLKNSLLLLSKRRKFCQFPCTDPTTRLCTPLSTYDSACSFQSPQYSCPTQLRDALRSFPEMYGINTWCTYSSNVSTVPGFTIWTMAVPLRITLVTLETSDHAWMRTSKIDSRSLTASETAEGDTWFPPRNWLSIYIHPTTDTQITTVRTAPYHSSLKPVVSYLWSQLWVVELLDKNTLLPWMRLSIYLVIFIRHSWIIIFDTKRQLWWRAMW